MARWTEFTNKRSLLLTQIFLVRVWIYVFVLTSPYTLL